MFTTALVTGGNGNLDRFSTQNLEKQAPEW